MPGPFATLLNQLLMPYSANNSRQNIGVSYAFDIQANVPIDGRSIAWTDTQRKSINYAYEGLEVRVLSTGRKFLFNRRNHPNGVAANNDAWWTDITESVARNGYKGPWNAATDVFPGATQANPQAGDYYIVSYPGTASIGAGAEQFELGDLAIYTDNSEAPGWSRIANYSPTLPASVSTADITDFEQQVNNLIAQSAIQLYHANLAYKKGQMVLVVEDLRPNRIVSLPPGITAADHIEREEYYGVRLSDYQTGGELHESQDANQTYLVASMYWALQDVPVNQPLGSTGYWLLAATTNYNRLYGRVRMDNTAGAGGTNSQLRDGVGVVMDIAETMRRVKQLLIDGGPGGAGGQIYGGAPDTPDSELGAPV